MFSTWIPRVGPALGLLLVLAGCTTTSLREAPIVERSERRSGAQSTSSIGIAPLTAAGGMSREARDGGYVVQRGDTLFSIALAFGQDYRDLARWNGLDDPSRLQVGQTLRVQPPLDGGSGAAVAAVPVAPVAAAEVRPLDAPAASTAVPPTVPSAPAAASGALSAAPPAEVAVPGPTPAPSAAAAGSQAPDPKSAGASDGGLTWAWPAGGPVVETFDETRNKGIDITGKDGDPVLAAGDGQVVYRGNGLRGYGNLVIVKHTDEFISAYAHNRAILVEQGQSVKRGQRIAEMGKSDADTPKLHFEVRRQGKPVDPLKLLPTR
ncbi:MAG: peptidoglycan DD-metalloendopeptidase family protein [Burkholderiaceae bacterium]|nr:peptidoglycan DD-metalloendopeptidase family protein [Burkholderiaceae bacterium]